MPTRTLGITPMEPLEPGGCEKCGLGAQLRAMPEADLERLAGTHPGEGIHDDGVDHAG